MKLDEKIHYEWKLIHNGEGKVPNIRLNSVSWLYKEFIWLVCGAGSGHGKSSQIWRFSLSDKTWEMVTCSGDGPSCRDGHSGTYIGNGKFVIFGGQGFPEPNNKIDRASDTFKIKTYLKREVYNDLLQFDCDNKSWSPIYPDGLNSPMGRRGHCAVFVGPSTSPSDHHQHIDSLDSASYSSNSLMSSSVGTTRSPYSRVQPISSGSEVPPNTLLVFGGSGIELSKYTEQLYNDLWAFSFADNCWSKLETSGIEPRPMFDHRMVRVGDVLVVAGGITGVSKTPPTLSNGTAFATDIMLLNLKTSAWSYLKLWDQYGQPARFNFHGFSLVADSHSVNGSAASTSLFVFGGNQVVDSRVASTTKGTSCLSAYPDDPALVLNIQDCTLLPVRCVQDFAAPENRYGHMGISCADADTLFNQMVAGTARDTRHAKRQVRTRKSLVDVVPDQQTVEPLMYIYGGAGIDRGGFPDPLLFQLVRVRTEISESFLPALGGEGIKTDDLASAATPGSKLDQLESPPREFSGQTGFKLTSRPGSPSSFMDDMSHPNQQQEEGRRNIWHNLQTKVGHQGEVRPPCNWSEMKLSLTAPFSQRVFETDRFENEEGLDSANNSVRQGGSTGKWGRSALHNPNSSGNFRATQSAPMGGSVDFLSLDLGNRQSSRMSAARGGLSRSQVLQINTRTNSRMHTGSSTDMMSQSSSIARPFTAPTLTPLGHHSPFGSGSLSDHHSSTSGDSAVRDRLRQERSERVLHMSVALRPIVRHKTKVAAKEQFLKMYPHNTFTEGM